MDDTIAGRKKLIRRTKPRVAGVDINLDATFVAIAGGQTHSFTIPSRPQFLALASGEADSAMASHLVEVADWVKGSQVHVVGLEYIDPKQSVGTVFLAMHVFARLLTAEFVRRRLRVEMVDPKFTSKDCSRCGRRYSVVGAVYGRHNREFTCECGLIIHADANASLNVRKRAQLLVRASEFYDVEVVPPKGAS